MPTSRTIPQTPSYDAARAASASDIARRISGLGPAAAAAELNKLDAHVSLEVLQLLNPAITGDIIAEMEDDDRRALFGKGPEALTQQWSINQTFSDDSVGRLMEPPYGTFKPSDTVGEVTNTIRDLVATRLITYCFVVDASRRLVGVVTMRDLLVADDSARLETVMLRDPFVLRPRTELRDAMKQVLNRHFPVYPVCDDAGVLIGLVRGQAMFEEQAFEISAQPGQMVGVGKEERLVTPWPRSLKFRHPWLQLNLFTAFIAAAVVGYFQATLDQIVILAIFLPVLAGQSGNTGCQALAVTLRGITLGELKRGAGRALVAKEALLGFCNGTLVGVTAGVGMYVVARMQSNPAAATLAVIVGVAMIGSCVVSGIAGAVIPLALRRVGADPATASSIFLTTATDVASMGMFLGLATAFLT